MAGFPYTEVCSSNQDYPRMKDVFSKTAASHMRKTLAGIVRQRYDIDNPKLFRTPLHI